MNRVRESNKEVKKRSREEIEDGGINMERGENGTKFAITGSLNASVPAFFC